MEPLVKLTRVAVSASFQDEGRMGYRRYGVSPSGFMDGEAALMANRMVGNLLPLLTMEYALGGLELEVLEDCFLGVCGAGGINSARSYEAGEVVKIPMLGDATWGYIAVYGGWKSNSILGSKAFHSRSNIGQELKTGMSMFGENENLKSRTSCFVRLSDISSLDSNKVIRVAKGMHFHLLDDAVSFSQNKWKLSRQMDRCGYRLDGVFQPHDVELRSLPVIPGAIQWTSSGQPIITMQDGPTVGGYPVVGMVHPEDLGNLAQRVANSEVNFEWYDLD